MIKLYVKNVDDVWFGVTFIEERILATTFSGSQQTTLSNLLNVLPFDVAFEVLAEVSPFGEKAIALLKDAYDGKEINQDQPPLAFEYLPPYSVKVLKAVFQIPVGYISSYALVASAVGGGARAVGNVMASNPFAPIIPCHRVVTSDFCLGGYGGGLDAKLEFLKRERKGYTEPKVVSVAGHQMQVFPTETVISQLEKKCPNMLGEKTFATKSN